MAVWTTGKVLAFATEDFRKRDIHSPRLEAEVLLTWVLSISRLELYTGFDRPLVDDELSRYREAIAKRRHGQPVAYITGRREFWSLELEVGEGVLVPRPETELLVECALEQLGARRALDLCTGSGCVALALAHERPTLIVDAVDLSAEALCYARRNATRHGLTERVQLLQGDLFAPLEADARYDIITANPPYVCDGELAGLDPEVQREPRTALAGGADGLDIVRRILAAVDAWLQPDGLLALELDARQAAFVAQELGPASLGVAGTIRRDLAGLERVVVFRKRGAP